jgi:hypothetical protein
MRGKPRDKRQESYDVPRVRSEPPYAEPVPRYIETRMGGPPSLQIPFSKQIKDDLPPSMSSRSFRRQEGRSCVGRRQDKTRSTNNCSQVKKEKNRQDKTGQDKARRQGKTSRDNTTQQQNTSQRKEKTRHVKTRQGKTKQDKKDKTRQASKTRQDR